MSRPRVDLSVLTNSGLCVLNDGVEVAPQRTLIVLGVARSGTTMIAGALHHLGIEMGMGDRPNAVFEDIDLSAAVERGDYGALVELVAQRDAMHDVWGWKRPASIDHMARIERYFRNPEYVVVFRDVFAIANRNRISMRSEIVENMEDALRRYQRLLSFLRGCGRRALLVSYEKAMLDKEAFLETLSRFAGVDATQAGAAAIHIRKDPETYLLSSRIWRGMGEITHFEAHRVMGWAFLSDREEPASVRLTINEREFGTVVADLPRPELKRLGKHPNGVCGFNFLLPKSRRLRKGDVVSVRVVGEAADLRGSPQRYRG